MEPGMHNDNPKGKRTIHVTTDLRRLLQIAAAESKTVAVANEVGLIDALDRLAVAGKASTDPNVRYYLHGLGLIDELPTS